MTLPAISARHITSSGNSSYRLWESYLKNPAGEECPWIAVEGRKQVLELAKTRMPELLLLSINLDLTGLENLTQKTRDLYYLSDRLFTRLSAVKNNQGLMAFFKKPSWTSNNLTDRVICLHNLQDPGNLGTIIRTAAALGGFSIVSSHDSVSFYNEKVVRASAGYLFTVPFLPGVDPEDLRKSGYQIWYSFPGQGIPLHTADLSTPIAVVFGSEGKGLGPPEISKAAKKLTIPMGGNTDSLNVAVASSLVMYEINRRIYKADG